MNKDFIVLLKAFVIVMLIFNIPLGKAYSDGIFIYYYKASISLLSAALLLKYCGKTRPIVLLVIAELIAIALNFLMLLTPFAHHLHNYVIELIIFCNHTYPVIPKFLFASQLLIIVAESCGNYRGNIKRFKRDPSGASGTGAHSNHNFVIQQG